LKKNTEIELKFICIHGGGVVSLHSTAFGGTDYVKGIKPGGSEVGEKGLDGIGLQTLARS